MAGLGRIWNRYRLTMLTWNRRDSTPLSAAPRAQASLSEVAVNRLKKARGEIWPKRSERRDNTKTTMMRTKSPQQTKINSHYMNVSHIHVWACYMTCGYSPWNHGSNVIGKLNKTAVIVNGRIKLLYNGTKPDEWLTQWDSNSVEVICQSRLLTVQHPRRLNITSSISS